MTIKTDHSTPRQYAEGVSPLTQVREYGMGEVTGTTGFTYECTARLRWIDRIIDCGKTAYTERVLQQAWVCRETGEIRWEDVPVENEND